MCWSPAASDDYRRSHLAGVAQRLEPQPSKLVVRVRFPSPAPVSPRGNPLKTPEKLLLIAASLLFAVGVIVAIAQPGDLGDEDDTAATAVTTTTMQVDVTTTVPPEMTTTVPAEVTTTIPGSGLGVDGPATGGQDGTGDTGAESMLGPGLALLGLGLVLRRLHHATAA